MGGRQVESAMVKYGGDEEEEEEDWEFPSHPDHVVVPVPVPVPVPATVPVPVSVPSLAPPVIPPPITIVLMGRTGNGKSATGNSILGNPAFRSCARPSAVTSTCQLSSSTLIGGRLVQVIDTPGLFDPTTPSEVVGKEIVRCIELAKEGVHAILLVLSTRNRFTAEEMAAVESLERLFGPKVVNYMIIVFTGGDELEENEEDLNDYLTEAPSSLMELLNRCGDRKVLFDNKTSSRKKKEVQLAHLIQVIDRTIRENDGNPYSNSLFEEAKERAEHGERLNLLPGFANGEIDQLRKEIEQAHADQLRRVTEMIEERVKECTEKLEKKLALEQQAREAVERQAREAKAHSEASINSLRQELEVANRAREEFQKKLKEHENRSACTIL